MESVRDQFWNIGYEATSIDDIMKVTGLGKGSLYNAFGSKRDLYLRVLGDYCRDVVIRHRRALAGGAGPSTPSPLARIERHTVGLAHSLGTESPRRGCFLSKATAELAAKDRAVTLEVAHAVESLAETLTEAVREAQNADEVDHYADPKTLGFVLLSIVAGVDCLSRAGVDKTVLTATVQVVVAWLARSDHRHLDR